MLLSICLGIFLVGLLIPNAFGDHESLWSDIDEIEEHAWIDSLPPGVKFPTPNFRDSASINIGDIVLIYEAVDFPQQSYGYSWGIFSHENIKLIEGNEQDLLVFDLRVKQDSDSPYIVRQEGLNMYDGKDRWFTPVTDTISKPMTTNTKNPAFGWNETCPLYDFFGTKFQAGIKAKMKFCFEIPKDSDHFKVAYSDFSGPHKTNNDIEIISGLAFIVDRAGILLDLHTFAKTPTVKPSEPTSPSAESSYVIIVLLVIAVVIGGIIVAILVAKKGSKPPTTVAKTIWKQTTVLFCGNCGVSLIPGARFCGKCGSTQS